MHDITNIEGILIQKKQMLICTRLQQCDNQYLQHISPIKIDLLIVSVVELTIDQALAAPFPTIRQQLEEAKAGPITLACTSAAPQLKLAGWA